MPWVNRVRFAARAAITLNLGMPPHSGMPAA